ncbi:MULTISPECIES: uL15m family ribosomal protein [Halobacterium]|uniref:Large ribosomal subunit protein uL15 n=5 Tax=Halobacterium salinarum TaxID=2242 RepID=RL15_HALSA|nr:MULTISPECIES: uL15m family ribosomal protein [Halobacterium]B0R678.1 RecName: Full=Large ribosomal subunit protein uL15; AltName: Full=50S ribosomal protein L15 [Halobacterium salinarum R1]P05971.3 RecName: Full=Large ribosomal subunit protein uL15; AltName: Full=50S ribosomal protein L15; AltName: Full=HL16 [Halobacterium salinarum NRC-1]AAG19958.1 50S ribosomal protein L15P [Halobacterium salinarum NRC-1]MBB6088964.1 large subunit ribosomal protein L15 [Halobacterium salinarum]MCF2164819.
MTDKKRRQRGSRTHGGGTHKNRRGAGNRGGRGRAGRKKHEQHNYEDVGKSGFKRPEKTDRDVAVLSVQELDEDIPVLSESGVAEETEFGYRVDARDVVDDGWDADVVKVLGGGQLYEQLEVTADAFSDAAVELIEGEGGDAVVSERASEDDEE